ncbi:MAG: tetratricopeptide repeat protein [Thermosynechococcaceae cyanobacterium]
MEILENGIEAFKSGNYTQAIRLLEPLAEQENAEAQCILGSIYHLGLGVEIDGDKAVKLYQKSAHNGHAIASNNLAGIYFMGECGITKSYKAALEWCQLSQKQGFEDSKYLEAYIKEKLNGNVRLD